MEISLENLYVDIVAYWHMLFYGVNITIIACYLFWEFFTLIQVTVECTKKELVTKLMDVQHSLKHRGLLW